MVVGTKDFRSLFVVCALHHRSSCFLLNWNNLIVGCVYMYSVSFLKVDAQFSSCCEAKCEC